MFDEYFYLGKITKAFGLKGELQVYLDTDEPDKYQALKSVFFDIQGEPIPFFIQSIKVKSNNHLIVKFDDIESDNAYQYINTDLYLPVTMLPSLSGNKFYYHEIKGFMVIDRYYGELGICQEVLEYPHQAVLQIINPKGEILIPLVDDIVSKIDRDNKIIEIKAPEGLIDVYIA